MARTRPDVAPAEKRDAIVAAARRAFLEDGYDASRMARIAADAGVAPNTVYWYFEDKDQLLIAVLDGLVGDAMAAYTEIHSRPLEEQLLWVLDRFESTRELIGTVHARLGASAAVRTWHERFHAMLESVIVSQLSAYGLPPAERAPAARIAMFVVEGLLSHHSGPADDRRAITSLLVARVVAGARD